MRLLELPQGQNTGAWRQPMTALATIDLAVLFERQRQPNRWEDWRFRLTEIVLDEGQFGDQPRMLRDDGTLATFVHPGLQAGLFRDEGGGYYLNLSSGAPVWFVMWRIADDDPSRAWPEQVTLSYNEAG